MYNYILALIVLAIGLFLFLRDKKPVKSSAEIIANASINRVWEVETDFSNWSRWNSDIETMHVNGDIGVGTVFIWKARGITIESTITEFLPNTTIAWSGKTFGINAYHVWSFSELGDSTRIYTEEVYTGILPWLMPGTMRKQIEKALKHGVLVLKQTAEQQSPDNAN